MKDLDFSVSSVPLAKRVVGSSFFQFSSFRAFVIICFALHPCVQVFSFLCILASCPEPACGEPAEPVEGVFSLFSL